jgi:hypothetical protein
MQPYFLPYIGYFQLIGAVDAFVVYDNIKYTKSGWINRNRFLLNGHDEIFSLPLARDSDFRTVAERSLAADFDRRKLLERLRQAYRAAPYCQEVMPLLERIVYCDDRNLFGFIFKALGEVCAHLGLTTPLLLSSAIDIDHGLKGQERVLAQCRALGAGTYINAIGGLDLYSREVFKAEGIELRFLRSRPLEYPQFGNPFVPWLSILDVLMFNSLSRVQELAGSHYDLE